VLKSRPRFSSLYESLPFAAFTFWLLAFPMSGPLQTADRITHPLILFLIPHIFALLGFAVFFPVKHLESVTILGGVLAAVSTLTYGLFPSLSAPALVFAGLGGAALAVRSGALLGQADKPVEAAGWSLIAANLLLISVISLPMGYAGKFLLTTIIALFPLTAKLPPQMRGDLRPLWNYLPFVLLYHVVAGLLYGFLQPLYQEKAWFSGSELIVYCLTVAMAAALFRKRQAVVLFAGFACALITCWFLYVPALPGVNLGMWTVQAACGFVDLFLVAYLATQSNPGQSFALGCAVLCLGVLGGVFFVEIFDTKSRFLVFSESIVLNLAVLAFFIFKRPVYGENNDETGQVRVPLKIVQLLSDRENEVLCGVLRGLRYREIASEMDISESTVKTYMNRIYEKTETWGKKALVESLKQGIEG
jgi:DNA-binding CsgD family transcriptional regulator